LTQDATAGTLHLSGDGSLSYTPAAGFSGVDSFTYQASVGSAVGSAEAQIYVVPVAVGATSTTLNLFALTPDQQIAADYIAYLGRAPDADGFHFWEGVFNSVSASIDILAPGFGAQIGGIVTLSNIAKTISGSAEGQALNPLLTNPNGASDAQVVALLSSEYDILFNRSPDAQGLAYWTSQVKTMLANGQSINLLPVAMMLGAQGQDITTLMSKVAVALAFVNDQEQSGTQWAGASDVAAATALVHAVTSDPETVLVGISNAHALIETHP